MDSIYGFFQTLGQYLYLIFSAIGTAISALWNWIVELFPSNMLPNSIKLFGNEAANKCLFFGILIFLLIMNIWAFSLFGADKSHAKRKQRRIKESKLMKACFFGGAIGGLIGMNVFRHKTLKKKFSIGIPIMFVIQLIIDSFLLGFIGFWTFF